ncbi:hypothetical protein H2201_003175 [Coniosporium apollinis]|uniref:Extracellular membrane protein CFEM domain-containing protein n=2 Tax=Coniosporium TaxID=2810619 RepID=A0ABQ9P0F9_9PEZI|nr:hypothetical protein H2199_008517 [Cladosporium sp. JES 115]KAJ9666771.1 hypothetical protein H2201_003175 [Coniosporium apollinis]
MFNSISGPSITFTLSFLAPLIYAATTVGPTARVSIWAEPTYIAARSCAACCIWYNGVFHPSNAGYYDLAIHLQCGAGTNNLCYCKADYASSVTAYLQSCVSSRCANVDNRGVDATSMVDLYNGYCATANVAVAAEITAEYATSTPTVAATTAPAAAATGASSTSRAVIPAQVTESGAAVTTTAAATAEGDDEGLSKSDIVAMAVALGLGIPSLVIGVMGLWMMRKRKKQHEAGAVAAAHKYVANAGGHLPGTQQGQQMMGTQYEMMQAEGLNTPRIEQGRYQY